MSIPKNIHQIWYQGWDQLPSRYDANVKSVIDNNPDWEHIKWDEKGIREVVASLGKEYLDKFDSFTILHQRIDFGRYAILYKFGGVSVDIDAVAHKGFDTTPSLSSSDFIVSRNSTDQFINNATILVSPLNPIMKDVLDSSSVECKLFEEKTLCVMNTAGLNMFNKVLSKYGDQVTILDNKYFEPCSGSDPNCVVSPETILDHQHDKSWVNPAYKKIEEFYYSLKPYRTTIIVSVIAIIVFFVLKRLLK